ncbi:hypothetical protein [Shewanella fidelis]|uniref:Uncharacterized protein n=1 Tax=Shewanella fidelis TaxID=173509 RepID=A0AAW8NKW6_9GAMM|nr:hypothetical protein [Shewanella fidelis]MDR8523843.1 hypothetical protein [Shewanella fidelis]MDW4810391.1 hypothetical protein [Shewanella fidelis]
MRQIISEVEQGAARLFCADRECYFVLRGETDFSGRELVIVAMAGKNAVKHTKEIHQRAKRAGYQTIRLHTLKPAAMLRMGRGLGYQPAETILRAVL